MCSDQSLILTLQLLEVHPSCIHLDEEKTLKLEEDMSFYQFLYLVQVE